MSREGGYGRIDSLKNSLNTEQYQRTGLGNAVRFNAALNIASEFEVANNEDPQGFESLAGRVSQNEFVRALDDDLESMRSEFDSALEEERGEIDDRFNTEETIQQRLANRAYRSRLGRSVAKATLETLGQYHDANSPFNSGATGAFRSFTNGFVQDDEDAFGSRVLYDNVFGQYEDGGESLTMQRRRTISDPTNNMNRTVGDKILDDIVNRSIYDQNEIITRVDTEFARFHGESMIDQMSMTGSGLKAARQTIREVMLDSSAYGRQIADRGENGTHPVDFAQAMINRVGEENISAEISEVQNSLTLLDNNLKNRSGQSAGADGGYVNKAGVAQFIDLINTAGTRSDSGELIGGQISISSFQFQNETISAALTDKIQRHVLESVLQGGTGKPLQVDLVLAYPRQRALNQKNSEDTRYGIGSTNYSILGPNLIEAMKLEEVKNDVFDMLRGLGVAEDNLQKYLNVNIQFRDKKFHPKVYLTDNVAGIGTQNLTGPVGNSVNQAGSNFETMRFVANKYKDDTQLEKARSEFIPLSNDDIRENADNSLKNGDVTQSLLYRQIVNAVEYEKNFVSEAGINRAGGSTATPIINSRRGNQVGFAGDIYEHLRNTLDYAYETNFNIVNGSQKGSIRKEVAGRNTTHMFMVLDQAFILQMGSDGFSKQLKGEMGSEVGSPFGEKDEAVTQYRQQQNKLFDLLIANKASVVVDAKNYQEQVMNPLIKKINKNQALKDNFERHGKSLGLMAGYDLFDPGAAATPEEYSLSMKAMRKELVRMGFTKEAGFDDTDLKQIIGLASGNIEMAKAPRQHVKSFGLMDYRQGGSPELVSYYMGSSNLGLYSLGIPTGDNGGFKATDGDLTNTEMGIMLGRRDMADGTNLSRVQDHSNRMSQGLLSDPTDINGIERVDDSALDQWSLTQEEERYELMLAQRHLVQTWSQLGNSRMENPNFKSVNTKPLWQTNVNTGDLEILKNRLETMARDLGIDPGASRSAFQIVERYGGVSGSGATSINVTIDIAQMLGSSGFMAGSAKLPKLNFELTVLQGPSRGSGMFNDRTDDGNVPGFVYFVDKNKVVGNGIFSNDSGKAIEVLGRNNYDDDFISDTRNGGRITLQSGQSAQMTSLDIVPQMFASLIGEGVKRFGANASKNALHDMNNEKRRETMIDFLSKSLSGRGDQYNESNNTIFTARELLLQDLNATNIHYLTGLIGTLTTSEESRADFREGGDDDRTRLDERTLTLKALSRFKGEVHELVQRRSEEGVKLDNSDLNQIVDSLSRLTFGGTLGDGSSHDGSTQLANQIMKISGRDPEEAVKVQEFKEFQTLMFGSFLQSRDDRTYGGQQGFYRTLLMGVGDSTIDRKSANLMFSLDEDNQGLHNLGAYARFKPLEYTPTTDIHQVMYRSVASKSTSMTKNDPGLNSMMFESEARDLGDAANLRLMSSIGIGTVMNRDNYILKDSDGNVMVGKHQQEIFDAMEAAGVDKNALAIARQEYVRAASAQFGDLNSNERGDTVRLQFYTGSAKKLSQLPQRIKNAMGARPLYQYSVEAQMALAEGESINELTKSYIRRNRDPLKSSIKAKVIELQDRLETIIKSNGTEEQIARVSKQLHDLKVIGSKAFTTETDGLGAVFSGQIKSVLNQEQISFVENTRSRLYEAMEELIKEGEVSDEQFNELLRVEVMKAGLVNKGLGKMIAGSNHMNYSMSIIQLTGTYNDTFLANSLYGTTYKSREAYDVIRSTDTDIYSLNQDQLKAAGVLNVGMTEGYFDTQQKSVKGSMMGEGGMDVLLQKGDVIVEDPDTGHYVQKRKVNNKWVIVNSVDSNRNLHTIGNIIDNTGFSDVGSPTLGSAPTTTYSRRGEDSVDYIYSAKSRPGNFANNEYLLQFDRLRSIKAGSGRRVEGTDSSSLVKGVAFFAGRIRKEYNGQEHTLNVFEDLERQYMENYALGEVGGSLKAYLDNSDTTQMVTLANGRQVHAPLSSSIQGVFNANNFKSFFWSHGATILKAQTDTPEGRSHFMLDELFSTKSQHNVTNAKKLAGALLLNFGTEFISVNSTDVETKNTEVNKVKRALVEGMIKGEYGGYHQKLAMATGLQLRTSEINSINNRVDKNGENRADITSQLLFDKMAKNSGYNGLTLGGIAGISSDQLMAVLSGDASEATKLLDRVRKGMLDPVARSASATGGINFDNHTHRGAAIVTTAVDLMHQLSRSGSNLQLPSDIDMNSEKVKEVLYNVMGLGGSVDDEFREDILQFIGSMNTDVNAVTVFTDITFSFSKDPVGTQSVGRHEAQHLITPFTGNLEKYRQGGQLDKIQHTVAGLQALVSGKKSGLVFYDQIARSGFAEKNALNLASADTDFMFTTFHKEKFLGFYQQGTSGISTDNFVKAYKDINRELVRDDSQYNWDTFQVTRDIGDATQISYVRQGTERISDMTGVNEAIAVINKHIDQFYPNVDPTERARLQDKFLRMGGQGFAMHQMDELVNQMSINNARFQADPRKTKGKDTTKQFLNNMQNKQMFVSIPDLEFSQQNGEILARTDRKNTISTIIPSADDMRALGAQYADFVDPILGHYKSLSAIFVPGTEENRVFEKVRLATQSNQPIFLSTAEFKIYKSIQDSAILMPTELSKGIANARTQEAFAGKNKYQGFTSTGIGSMLMPFGAAALSQAKLDEAGMRNNKARVEAVKESDRKVQEMSQRLQRRFTDKEAIYIALEDKFGAPGKHNNGDFQRSLQTTVHFSKEVKMNGLGSLQSTMSTLNRLRKEGFAAQRHDLSRKAQAGNMVSTLNELQRLHDQLDRIRNSNLETESTRLSISQLQDEVVQYRSLVLEEGRKNFGLQAYTAGEAMAAGGPEWLKEKQLGIYDAKSEYVTLDNQDGKNLGVYAVYDDASKKIVPGGSFVGEDALPVIHIHKETVKGFVYEEDGQEIVLQRAGFQATYGAKGLSSYQQLTASTADRATERVFDEQNNTRQTHIVEITERSKAYKIQNLVMQEMSALYPEAPTQEKRIARDIVGKIEERINSTEDRSRLNSISKYLTNLTKRRSDIDVERVEGLQQRIALKRSYFDSGEVFGPKIPSPVLRTIDSDPRADLTRDSKRPAAWETVRERRNTVLQRMRAGILASTDLDSIADTILNRIDSVSPELQGPLQQMLDEDIPKAFDRIANDPWLSTEVEPYPKGFFTPAEEPQRLLPGASNSEDVSTSQISKASSFNRSKKSKTEYTPTITRKDNEETYRYKTQIGSHTVALKAYNLHGRYGIFTNISFGINGSYDYDSTLTRSEKLKSTKWLMGAYDHFVETFRPTYIESEVWAEDGNRKKREALYKKMGFEIDGYRDDDTLAIKTFDWDAIDAQRRPANNVDSVESNKTLTSFIEDVSKNTIKSVDIEKVISFATTQKELLEVRDFVDSIDLGDYRGDVEDSVFYDIEDFQSKIRSRTLDLYKAKGSTIEGVSKLRSNLQAALDNDTSDIFSYLTNIAASMGVDVEIGKTSQSDFLGQFNPIQHKITIGENLTQGYSKSQILGHETLHALTYMFGAMDGGLEEVEGYLKRTNQVGNKDERVAHSFDRVLKRLIVEDPQKAKSWIKNVYGSIINNDFEKYRSLTEAEGYRFADEAGYILPANSLTEAARNKIFPMTQDTSRTVLESSIDEVLKTATEFKGGFLAEGEMTTYRGIPVRIASTLSVGQTLQDRAVTSTSKNLEVGKNFARGKGTVFIIEGQSGRDLSSFSDFDNEDEVLFKPNAKFEVTKIDTDSERYEQVFLREVFEGGALEEESAALKIAQRTSEIMKGLPSFVEPTKTEEVVTAKDILDVERFGFVYGESETEEFLGKLSDSKNKVKKLRRQVNKYRKRVLDEDTDVERKRRKTKDDWQYLLRSTLDLDASKESSFIAKTIESRILTGSDISMPSKYSDLQSKAESLYATLESDNKDVIDLFRKLRLNSQNEVVDITLNEVIDTANRFEDLRAQSGTENVLPSIRDPKTIYTPLYREDVTGEKYIAFETAISGKKIQFKGVTYEKDGLRSAIVDFSVGDSFDYDDSMSKRDKFKAVKWIKGAYESFKEEYKPEYVTANVYDDDFGGDQRAKNYRKAGFDIKGRGATRLAEKYYTYDTESSNRFNSFFDSGEMFGPSLPNRVIVDYLGGSYKPINRVLRGQIVDDYISDPEELRLYTEETSELANKLKAEVGELPSFKGTTYRGLTYDPELEVGGLFKDRAFMSTSENYSTAESFSERGMDVQQRTIFTIEGESGRDVSKIPGVIASEREVLFQPEVSFKVINAFTDDKNIKHYTLREVSDELTTDRRAPKKAGTFERSGRMINSGFESIAQRLENIKSVASDEMTYTKPDGTVVKRKSYGRALGDPIDLNIARAREQFDNSVSRMQEATSKFERVKQVSSREDRNNFEGAFQGAKRSVQQEVEKTYSVNALELATLYQNIENRIGDLDNMSEAQRQAYNLSEDKVAIIRGELTGILSDIESQLSMVNAKVIKIEKGDSVDFAYMQPQNRGSGNDVVSQTLGSAFTMTWKGQEKVLISSKVFTEPATQIEGPPKPPKPPSRTINAAAEPPEEPSNKIVNPPLSDPSTTAVRHESNARRAVNETYRTRYAAEPRVVEQRNSLVANLKSFHRKQKAAIALGISSNLESEFDIMKREAIKTKNMIAEYRDSNFLTEDEKRAAFTDLKGKLMEKRNQAYAMANISPETGKEIGINPETGEAIENRPGFDQRRPSLNDSYIYHAQALNYDQLLTHLSLLGNATGVEELSKEHVKDLQRKSTFIRKYGSFALNSYEDGDGKSTFFGLGHQEVGFDTKALFVIENTTPDAGSAQRHMKAINQITEEATKMGMTEASKTMASQYATQQIDAQIAMYKNRAQEMRKFSEEREAHSSRRDSDGNLVIDEATNRKISSAHQDYETNTNQIIDFLEAQKSKINNGSTKAGQIRTIFEDIDTMVAATDRANLQMAEVFRPPTPGGTDPRLHTYRVMQGVMALNQVSSMLQDTGVEGTGMSGQNTKMIYSTERGQTATVMSALGIVTYGGGDWDGDSYTAIFHQAEEIQSAIQKHKGKKNESELLMKGAIKEAESVRQELKAMNPSDKDFNKKAARLQQLEATVEEKRNQVARSNQDFESAKADMELKIQSGYRGLTARARKQVSNYMGIDERHFVSSDDVMYDVNGNVIKDASGKAVTGLRQGATQDADALFVYIDKGYELMEGIDSKRNQVVGMMNNIDALTGYRTNPKAFDDDGWLKQLSTGITLDPHTNKISSESPGIAMLKDRANSVLNENQNLNEDQRAFLNTLANADDDTSRAWLEEFGKLTKEMGMQDADESTHSRNQVAYIKDAKERRARMNRWIANDLFNPMLANETVGKFMQQGMGMNLTEGTFDMTLKILGKAGGEVLGKTYNTIIGSTFQDAPVITYGTQIMDEKSGLYHATMTEFQKQAERRFETHEMSQDKALLYEDGKEKGLSGKKLDNYVATQIRKVGYEEFRSYRDQTIAAVEKSGDVQGFMKNIHQLMRDSIKLKGDTSTLQDELDILSKDYDDLSKKMASAEDEGDRLKYGNQRDRIVEGMASKLGPGPGLKSLIDLDYLTNESDKTGITRTDFESRFFEGAIEDNRERLLSMGASMNLSSAEMDELRGIKSGTRNDETASLLKVARGQTARNLGAMITSYQMARVAGDGRSQQVKELANTQRAKLATQIEAHAVPGMPLNRTANGQIDVSDVIDNKYTRVIEREHEGAKFDANRQHKEALGAHLGLKESQIFDDNGQITQQYTDELRDAATKMGVDQDEYLLAYDHILENNREVIGGIFGNDGEKMGQFTTMNMMRKNVAQSMLTGQNPSSEGAKVINESIGGEVITTMAQLAAQGKLDSQGMEVFSGMYKGVMRHLIEATGQKIDVYNPTTGKIEEREYNSLDAKSKNAVMTKLMYENMFGTQVSNQKGFTRATSDQARDFKASTGQFIADSVLELRDDGTLGNDFIDALDKAGEGSSTKAQKDMFEAMGEEYLRETLNSEEMTDMLLKQYLIADGQSGDLNSDKAKAYRRQIATSTRAQMKRRQDQATRNTALSRSRHSRGYGVQSRSSFMNNMNSDVIGQLSKDSRANALDLVMPLLLTAAGTAISEGSIGKDQLMALSGAAFTSFQYARTGTIDHGDLTARESKKRLAAAQATSGIFKLKNAMMQHGDENMGAAIAQVAVSEAVSVGFNMAATPWLSKNIAEKGFGAGAAPAMNAMDRRKFQAGHQLAGNVAASAISAVSSTLISGLLMNTMQGQGPSLSDTIQSFLPAAQAVSQVNEAIARRRAQEAAFDDFQAETDGTNDTIQEYMVVTDATYNPDDYSSIADLSAAQEVEPGSDGSLSVGILG